MVFATRITRKSSFVKHVTTKCKATLYFTVSTKSIRIWDNDWIMTGYLTLVPYELNIYLDSNYWLVQHKVFNLSVWHYSVTSNWQRQFVSWSTQHRQYPNVHSTTTNVAFIIQYLLIKPITNKTLPSILSLSTHLKVWINVNWWRIGHIESQKNFYLWYFTLQ